MGSLLHSHMWFLFNLEITRVSLLVLLTILWVLSICLTNDGVFHRQGLMMDKPPKLPTGLVLKD